MTPVVVVGISHHNTLGIIRSLGRKGLKDSLYFILIGHKDANILKSMYLQKDHVFIVEDNNQIIDALKKINFVSSNKAIVICSSDPSIAVIDAHRNELSDKYIIPNANLEEGNIKSLMDKDIQDELAMENGLLTPESFKYIKGVNSERELDNWTFFPTIVKPIDSVTAGKTEIRICKNNPELKNDIAESNCASFHVQQFIQKTMEFQLIGCSLAGGDEIIIPGYTDIIRQPDNTNTGFLHYCPLDSHIKSTTVENVKKLIHSIGYSGLFSAEFIKDEHGTDYFLEINFRNDGNAICVTDAGVNLPYIWYAYNAGLNYKEEAQKSVHSLYCMPEVDDLILVLKHQVSFRNWLKDLRRTTSFMEYDKEDKSPFYKKMCQFVKFLIKRSLHL